MNLNTRKKYIDEADGTIKTGAAWLKYIKIEAEDSLKELERDLKRAGEVPVFGENIPTLEEQIEWILKQYTSGGECVHNLKEYKRNA